MSLIRWHLFIAGVLAASASLAQVQFPKEGGVGLVPPDGMLPADDFSGFEDPSTGSSILVVELPAEAFDRLEKEFTPDVLLGKGVVAAEPERRVLPGSRPALFMRGSQWAQGVDYDKWLLVARGERSTALITVQIPQEIDAYPDEVIDAVLESVVFRVPGSLGSQMDALPFDVEDLAGFRAYRVVMGSGLLLTHGPEDTFADGEQPLVILGASLGDTLPVEDERATFAKRALANIEGLKGIAVESITVDANDIHIVATAVSSRNNVALFVLQSIRFFDDRYVRLIGLCRASDRETYEARFERIGRSLAKAG